MEYTKESLEKMDNSTLVSLLLEEHKNVEKLTHNVDILTERINAINANKFGKSSEKNLISAEEYGQTTLFNEAEATADPNVNEPTIEETVKGYTRKARPKGKKEQDLSGFPTEDIYHTIDDEKLSELFPNGYKLLPEESYPELECIPASYKVLVHHIAVYADKKEDRIVKADRPNRLLRGSILTPSLAAAIINGKYTNALPFYRIEQEFERNEVSISRQTMANWMIKLSEDYLSVVCDRMRQHLMDTPVVQADETPVKVSKDKEITNRLAYMWVYRTGDRYPEKPVIIYDYGSTRKTSNPCDFLKGYKGLLVTDGYVVYHSLDKKNDDITVCGCWAHARRRFCDAVKAAGANSKGTIAAEALIRIGKIYNADGMCKKNATFAEIKKHRQKKVKKLVDEFFVWVKEQEGKCLPKSKTGDGISYCINQETFLRRFLDHGDIPMDNNGTERAIRGFTIGRKNFVMIDTVNGAKASATMYSLVETAKANDLKIYEYIKYLLSELPDILNSDTEAKLEDLDYLMPWSEKLPDYCKKKKKEES